MNTAVVCSVRVPKKDSEYVQIGLTYQDDTTKLFFADGARYDNAVIKREEYEKIWIVTKLVVRFVCSTALQRRTVENAGSLMFLCK